MNEQLKQSLETIKKVCSLFQGNLEQHQTIQQAIKDIEYKLEDQGEAYEDVKPNE